MYQRVTHWRSTHIITAEDTTSLRTCNSSATFFCKRLCQKIKDRAIELHRHIACSRFACGRIITSAIDITLYSTTIQIDIRILHATLFRAAINVTIDHR